MIKPYSNRHMHMCTVVALAFLAVLLLMSSCGSGSSHMAGGGVGGTGKYTGVITGFGSVVVKGYKFETTEAVISVDGSNASEDELRIGMKVDIDAAHFNALSIVFEPEVEGPVTGIDPVAVLGQILTPDSSVVFEGLTSLSDLHIGDIVEVSGFIDSRGSIVATYIKREDSALEEFQVTGMISNHDPANKTFKINGLTVDYRDIQNPPLINDGAYIEAEGSFAGGILTARELEDSGSLAHPGEEVEFEGIITRVTSPEEFEVNYLKVETNTGTEYHHGNANNILENVRVEVKGRVNESGIIIVKELEFES